LSGLRASVQAVTAESTALPAVVPGWREAAPSTRRGEGLAAIRVKARSWKAAETRFARDVGTERKPCDGSRDGADFASGPFCYQLKYRKSFPSWIWAWLRGITGKARWKDWVELHGKPPV